MRTEKIMRNCWLLLLPALTMLASSCSGSSDAVVESNDYCYIKSVTLGTVKRKLDIRDRQGGLIRTTNSTFTGSSYAMTIDHRNGIIENRDSLPFGRLHTSPSSVRPWMSLEKNAT